MRHSVVIEIGKQFMRGGFAGESCPRFVTPLHHQTSESSSSSNSEGGLVDLPLTSLHEIMQEIFQEKLLVKPKECRVLIVENIFTVKKLRQALFQILFSECQVDILTCKLGDQSIYRRNALHVYALHYTALHHSFSFCFNMHLTNI